MKNFFKILLVIVNVVVAVLFLLSASAGSIPPSSFEWASLLSYGCFMLLLINMVFVVLWLLGKSWFCLVSLVPIVLRIAYIPLYFQLGGSEVADDDPEAVRITVLDYNTHMFNGPTETDVNADSNVALFIDMLREENPDVMALQEFYVPGGNHLADTLKALGYKYSYGPNKSGNVPYGVAVFSKYKITNEQKIDENRKFYVEISPKGKKVRLAVVHMDSYELTTENLEELNQLGHQSIDSSLRPTVRKLRNTYKNHEQEWNDHIEALVQDTVVPLILCGDFNDTPASYLYQRIAEHLSDCYVEQGHGFCNTYHGMFPNFRIDYIFHSPSLKALTYKRIKNDISDHYPILSTIEL